MGAPTDTDGGRRLRSLLAGQAIPFGGDRVTFVDDALAAAFSAGDRLVVVQDTGDLLHVPASEHELVSVAVGHASTAFAALAAATDDQITRFFDAFAANLADDRRFAEITAANEDDLAAAASRGRSTTRLALSEKMRTDMIAGLHTWRDTPGGRDDIADVFDHEGWTVTARKAPLGVVGFVFEGRPNVFADATGVLRTGNTAVLRIGRDALGTARAIVRSALQPALAEAGLAAGCVTLIDSPSRAAGWALFSDARLALAVARGSGQAVTQLGAVARQSGVPVSLHGTGGAWLIGSAHADTQRFHNSVLHSLDRKVCNTLNVCCIVVDRADELVPVFIDAVRAAAAARHTNPRLHVVAGSSKHVPQALFAEQVTVTRAAGDVVENLATEITIDDLATEWEWEVSPEVSLVVVADVAEAVELFNAHSPHLAASLISTDASEHDAFYESCDAPFIGDGFTRWVDGQFALDRPELGLSNWEHGRLLARSAVLSGDSVFTVRLSARVADSDLHR